jgi:hypothetical protein
VKFGGWRLGVPWDLELGTWDLTLEQSTSG